MENEIMPWEAVVYCPFCNKMLLRFIEYDELSAIVNDDEEEERIRDNYKHIWKLCEHTAFTCEFFYLEEKKIGNLFRDEMKQLAKIIKTNSELLYDGRDTKKIVNEFLYDGKEEKIKEFLHEVFEGREIKIIEKRIKASAGPRMGGPRFMFVLIK